MAEPFRPEFQVALDCADPHRLAVSWAEALGYDVVQPEAQIQELLAAGVVGDDDVITVDGHLAWRTGSACTDPGGTRPRWFFQLVSEPKVVKNRMHVDVRIGEEGREEHVARMIALGATRLYEGQEGPSTWITLTDPEGNEFCVS